MNLRSHSISSLQGVLTVPGDKSISHRAAILGGLAKGVTEVDMTWQKCWDISWFRLSRLWYSSGAGKSCTGKSQAFVLMEK